MSCGLAHTDVTTPFQPPCLPSPCQPLCSAPICSLYTYLPAFLLLPLPHQPFSNTFSGCSHTHSPCLPLLFPPQLSTSPSSHRWPAALHILSSALLTPAKPYPFCSFPSLLLFRSGSKSCSLRSLSSSSWPSSAWLPSHSPAVSQASAEETPNFYLVSILKKNNRQQVLVFFCLEAIKALSLIGVNSVSQVSQSLIVLCSFL